nr:NAD(P)-binding protein [Euryarchaeota archaeon]
MNEIDITGGGLSGLITAYRIGKEAPQAEINLYEKNSRFGGSIITVRENGYVEEGGPSTFRYCESTWKLVKELSLENVWEPLKPAHKKRWIRWKGKNLTPARATFTSLIPRPWRFPLVKKLPGGSIADRFPRDRRGGTAPLANAISLGIVNAPADEVDAAFVMRRRVKGPVPHTFSTGIDTLTTRLVELLQNMDNVKLHLNSLGPSSPSILASPPQNHKLNGIQVVGIGFSEEDCEVIPQGFGILSPDSKEGVISGILHSTDHLPGERSPVGHRLFRAMIPDRRLNGESPVEAAVSCMQKWYPDLKDPAWTKLIASAAIPEFPPGCSLNSLLDDSNLPVRVDWSAVGPAMNHIIEASEKAVGRIKKANLL